MLNKLRNRLSDETLLIIAVFLPACAESASSFILSAVLSVIHSNVDKFILSSISFSGTITAFAGAFYSSIATGTAILMSHLFGANNRQKMEKLFRTSMAFGFIVALFLAIPLIVFSEPILRAIYPDLSNEFIHNSKIYLMFTAATMPFSFIIANSSGIMRACLNNKGPYAVTIMSSGTRLILDFIFLVVFDFGIYGLCISLLLSNISSIVISSYILKKMAFLPLEKGSFKDFFAFDIIKNIFNIAYVVILQSILSSIGGIILTKYVSQMDELFIMVRPIYNSVFPILYMPAIAMSHVAQSFSGKYKGAGDELYSMKITLKLNRYCIVLLVIIALISYPLAPFLIGLYTDDVQIAEMATKYLRLMIVSMPLLYGTYNILPAGLRGAGHVKLPAIVLASGAWIIQLPLVRLFCINHPNGSTNFVLITILLWVIYSAIFYVAVQYKKYKLQKIQL